MMNIFSDFLYCKLHLCSTCTFTVFPKSRFENDFYLHYARIFTYTHTNSKKYIKFYIYKYDFTRVNIEVFI